MTNLIRQFIWQISTWSALPEPQWPTRHSVKNPWNLWKEISLHLRTRRHREKWPDHKLSDSCTSDQTDSRRLLEQRQPQPQGQKQERPKVRGHSSILQHPWTQQVCPIPALAFPCTGHLPADLGFQPLKGLLPARCLTSFSDYARLTWAGVYFFSKNTKWVCVSLIVLCTLCLICIQHITKMWRRK